MSAPLRHATPLPRLWFFTDPARTPDPVAVARTLPRGTAVVYRHFGAADRLEVATALRRLPGVVLLIGADPGLAELIGADGVHLPERLAAHTARLKRRRPRWLITVAAHSARALRLAAGADAAVLSPVYGSRSPSAGAPLGVARAALLARTAPVPVIALGGVTHLRARALARRGFAGAAGIDMFL